jgi:predicted transcriptional regulator
VANLETSVLTLRVSNKTKKMLEDLSEATQRTKSFLASEAIERYLEIEAWQVKEIKTALIEADNNEFIDEKDFAELIKKYGS